MPELPEVESLRRLLQRRILGAGVQGARFDQPVVLKSCSPTAFSEHVADRRISAVDRRGKYLILALEHHGAAGSLVIHLRMRGILHVEPWDRSPGQYVCAVLRLDTGQDLRYYDMWRWGEWRFLRADEPVERSPGIATLGLEPFDPAFTPEWLHRKLSGRRGSIKPLLLGQRLVAGLGNIYVDECLHRAGIHPALAADRIDSNGAERLRHAVFSVLSEAVASGGKYAEQLAARGEDLERFDEIYTPRVYNRPDCPCPTCGERLRKISFCGRGTTYCPCCQPVADSERAGIPDA